MSIFAPERDWQLPAALSHSLYTYESAASIQFVSIVCRVQGFISGLKGSEQPRPRDLAMSAWAFGQQRTPAPR
eukprot:scaffold118030_cov28-Prasinocladus_malaysianus.AAC.1